MKQYMLDTNIISYLIKSHPMVMQHVIDTPMRLLCMSAITEGELLFGLAKRPKAKRLHLVVKELLRRVDVLPWDSVTAEYYGNVRASMVSKGKTLAPLDLLIAAHALSVKAILVTNDKAFSQITDLQVEDWSKP